MRALKAYASSFCLFVLQYHYIQHLGKNIEKQSNEKSTQ